MTQFKIWKFITLLCAMVMILPSDVFSEGKNEASIIVATGKEVTTGGILGSLPEKYPANAVQDVEFRHYDTISSKFVL